MITLIRPVAAFTALFLLLTYLLLRGTAPYLPEQDQRLRTVNSLVLNQATLERDALRLRAGLLANYDPLIDTTIRLRLNLQTLQANLPDWPNAAEQLAGIRDAIRAQEPLIDAIKSSNALVLNSLAYFGYLVADQAAANAGLDRNLAHLATEMLRISKGFGHASESQLAQALDQYERSVHDDPPGPLQSIGVHGRAILQHMAVLDDKLSELNRSPVEAAAVSFRSLLVERYAYLDREASIYQGLLYLTAIVLLGYLSILYLKLRRSAGELGRYAVELEDRSTAQSMISTLSTSFIDIPPGQIRAKLDEGLALLGRQFDVDRSYLVIGADADRKVDHALVWPPANASEDWPASALRLLQLPAIARLERDGCLMVPDVDKLSPGHLRAALEAQGVRAWLGFPIAQAGGRVGVLGFDMTTTPRDWQATSLQHLRIASNIFAQALERQRAEMEREALTGRLVHAERMQAIGTLAGGIAHNFNNILGAILGYAEMAVDMLEPDAPARRHVDAVCKAGTRAKLLVDQIMTFGRRSEFTRLPVPIAPLIEETIDLLEAVQPATVTIDVNPSDMGAIVLGDPTQLQQIIMNLCTNASQSMDDIGRIDLGISTFELREQRILSHGTMSPGRCLLLTVADHGHGMEQATVEQIFDPFFTTKPAGRGTGLGLATVHKIVTDHGGAINVTSHLDEGTVFDIYLPAILATDRIVPPSPAASGIEITRGEGQTVLLVDDEEMLVALTEEILAGLGYEPVGFTDPLLAIQVFEADPNRFDLVLSDMVMPGMTGDQLATRISQIRPDLPVLLMTGYSDLIARKQGPGAAGHSLLQKPLSSLDLAVALGRQFTLHEE